MTADRFDQDLRAVLREGAPDGAPLALRLRVGEVATQRSPGRTAAVGPLPRLAWVLLVAALLVALLAATGFVGAGHPDLGFVIAPPPSPTPVTTLTVVDVATDILATTKARPLPAQATCPAGLDPDAPGPAGQERPGGGAIAFDRHAGQIVLVDDNGFRMWTFGVCTNAWQRIQLSPPDALVGSPDWVVYDADSDRTVALTRDGQFWSYDLVADRWTKAGRFPDGKQRRWGWGRWHAGAVYHDPSGLVIIHDGATMWAYDVEAGTLTEIRQRPDPSRPADSGLPSDPWAFEGAGAELIGYDAGNDLLVVTVLPARPRTSAPHPAEETWTFDPSSSTWRFESSAPPPWSAGIWGFEVGRPAAYDEVSGRTLFLVDGTGPWAFDGGQRAWSSFVVTDDGERQVTWCKGGPVYDPLNGRLVCLGGATYDGEGANDVSGVSAFSTATGQWRWLLEPLPAASPAP